MHGLTRIMWYAFLGGIALFLLCGTFILVVVLNQESLESQVRRERIEAQKYAAKIIPLLTHDEQIGGEWERIRFPEAVIPVNWRKFSKTGKMSVCYGDIIMIGTYGILDKKTVETRNWDDSEINKWTFGFKDGELIMINQTTSWVEEYRRLPKGSLAAYP